MSFPAKWALVFLLIAPPIMAEKKTITICTDNNLWYPFTYMENNRSKGLHVDIVRLACNQIDWQCKFTPLPWKRCLSYMKRGGVDGVVSASYKPKRADYMHYPPGAEKDKKSIWRVTQAEYVVVTALESGYQFTGDLTTLPQPVRAPLGYSIVDDLTKSGVEVTTQRHAIDNFVSLAHSKRGSVISITTNARYINQQGELKNSFKIHSPEIKSKSYYMAFSKKSTISPHDKGLLWQAIVDIRENQLQMKQLIKQY